ncbi:hypothetical protein PN498_16670 [Oscillatoria sp. CS-180]|uniref:hypothetical protein n=1 Tax=Oscillatoria sp. CS-180 TaxID=3021720 RepID=UPI00233009AE|nr:hypothetical protein [Oscillatoria sp. CS-180]MDB9527632.1 hypothetical protein [Oscillatoria sp. CS-180]
MEMLSNKTVEETSISTENAVIEEAEVRPLSLSRKAELWSGRFAMIGFMTTAMAIAFKATI